MSFETLTAVLILVLFIVSNAFWLWQTHRLLNKLMSRNYFEYEQSKTASVDPMIHKVQVPDFDQADDLRALNEMIPRF